MRKILKSIFLISLLTAIGISQPDWTVNPADFEFSGSVTAAVQVDDSIVGSNDDLLAAFVDDEIRGVINGLFYPTGEYYVFLLVINSNLATGETVTFQYYNAATDSILELTETVEFTADMIVGNAVDPFDFYLYTDCFGTISGDAVIDDCGQCCGGETGAECSYYNDSDDFGGLYDCNGVCSGEAVTDDCGVCCAGSSGVECSYYNSSEDFGGSYDCAGACFGTSELDSYGNCCEGTEIDCGGLCYGEAELDDFFDCCVDPDLVYFDGDDDGLGDPDSTAFSCGYIPQWVLNGNDQYPDCGANYYDCAGECGGDAIITTYYYDNDEDGLGGEIAAEDYCSSDADDAWVTVGGDVNDEIFCESNNIDCADVCDGEAVIDECGICSGGITDHIYNSDMDCAGECFGTADFAFYWQDLDGDGLGGELVGSVCDAFAEPEWVTNDEDLYDDIYCESNDFDCALVCDGDAYIDDFYFDNDGDGLGGALAATDLCSADADEGWVTNDEDLYDDIFCESNVFDCYLTCDGSAVTDDCGDCVEGETGLEYNYNMDCAGVCFGDAFIADFYFDNDGDDLGGDLAGAGICSADALDDWVLNGDDVNDDIFCESNDIDCADECDGVAFFDDCGICSGGTSGHPANSDQDCAGECFGTAEEFTYYEDLDGDGWGGELIGEECDEFADPSWVLNGDDENDDSYCESNIFDCAGVCDGDDNITNFYYDNDGDGLGGEFAAFTCSAYADESWVTIQNDVNDDIFCLSNTIDCNDVCDGEAIIDDCDDCTGGDTGFEPNYAMDCAGVCDGEAVEMDYWEDLDGDGWGGTSMGNMCSAYADETWVNNGLDNDDDIYCESNNIDCADECDGLAVVDDCSNCAGGSTGLEFNYAMDCAGVCDGDAELDECGVCEGPGASMWYQDGDGDGWGDPNEPLEACEQPEGYVNNNEDVNDVLYCLSNLVDDCGILCGDGSSCNAPRAFDSFVEADENTLLNFTFSANDPNDDVLTAFATNGPGYGSLEIVGLEATYIPSPGYSGMDYIFFQVTDGQYYSSEKVVTITVIAGSSAPMAEDIYLDLNEDQEIFVTLIGTSNDSDDEFLEFEIVDLPLHGSIAEERALGYYTYLPDQDYFGADSGSYRIYDSNLELYSEIAWVHMDIMPINDPPVIDAVESSSGSFEVEENDVLPITVYLNDVEGDELELGFSEIFPANGTIDDLLVSGYTINFNYYPDPEYYGADNVIFWAEELSTIEQLNSQQFNIDIVVTELVEPPLAFDQTASVLEEDSVELMLSGSGAGRLNFALVDLPMHGTATLDGQIVTYTPDQDFDESDTFTFVTSLNGLDSEPATVTVNVLPVNDPPVVSDFGVDTGVSTQFDLTPYFTDVDNTADELTTLFLPESMATFMGGMVEHVDGFVYEYIPPGMPVGEDYIMYKLVDMTDESAYGLITFTVPGGMVVNFRDAPMISVPGLLNVSEDGALGVTILALDTSGNMFDGSAAYDIVTGPMHGTLEYVSGPTSPTGVSVIFELLYTPAENYFGEDSFEVTVTNPNNPEPTSDPAIFNVMVNAVNDVPAIAALGDQSVDEDGELVLTVVGTDVDNDLTYSASSTMAEVIVTVDGDQLTIMPIGNWNGDATITVVATEVDGADLTAQTSFDLTVNPLNDPPVMVAFQNQITLEEVELVVPLYATDIDGETEFTFDAATDSDLITISVVGNSLTITPLENLTGIADISVWALDGSMASSMAFEFSLTIVDTNDPPMLDPLEVFEQTVSEDGDDVIYTITPTDVDDGDILTLEVVASNTGMFPMGSITIEDVDANSGVSRTVTLNPSDNSYGTSVVIFNVTDLEGENFALQTFINVTGEDDAPSIISNAPATVLVDELFTYAVIAADPDPEDQNVLTFSITNEPAGMMISPTGLITWTPDDSFTTSGPVTVRVEDPDMLWDEQTFTVEVLHFDCAGVPGGSAYLDACGICAGGDTGFIPNVCGDIDGMNGLECASSWFGPDFDDCGVCFGPGESIWYEDADGDGLGDMGSMFEGCEQPPGFVDDSSDSDDSIYCVSDMIDICGVCDGPGELTWYMDFDGDGLGDSMMSIDACTQPDGYVADSSDSDDSIYCESDTIDTCGVCDGPGALTWYMDDDGDGLGDPVISIDACTNPGSYVLDDSDSDDSIYCVSDIIDGCGVCDGPGIMTWYMDGDADGLGDPNTMTSDCTQPDGYVADGTDVNDAIYCISNSIDCNDECDGTADVDMCGDCSGGSTGIDPCFQDCAGVWGGDATVQTYFYDNDLDGLGGMEAGQFCSGTVDPALVLVPGDINDDIFCVSNTIDCNDECDGTAAIDLCGECTGGSTGLLINGSDLGCGCFEPAPTSYYIDTDGDGDGFGDDMQGFCDDPGPGWSMTNTDLEPNCATNDTDCAGTCGGSAVDDDCGYCTGGDTGLTFNFADLGCGCEEDAPMMYYPDADGDGDGAGDVTTDFCEDPGAGWSLTNTDPEPDCASDYIDCAGVCDGTAVIDCFGVCDGGAYIDICGICGTDETACSITGNIWSGNLEEIIIGDMDRNIYMSYPPFNEIYYDGDYVVRDEAGVDVWPYSNEVMTGYTFANPAYIFNPSNLYFRNEVTITVPYDLPLGRLPADNAVLVWLDNENDAEWTVVDDQTCDSGICTGNVHSMGIFTVVFHDGMDLPECVLAGITFAMDPDAYVDNCGACISDQLTNDACIQDDTGAWGGTVFCDACGVCDSDLTNDNACRVEASDFHVFPNPFSAGEAVYFSYDLDRDCSAGSGVIQIYDFAGDEVDKITLTGNLLSFGHHEIQWMYDSARARGGYVAVFVFDDGSESGKIYTKIGIR